MADHSRSHSSSHHDRFHLLGFRTIRRAYKAFISKCHPDHKNSPHNSKKRTTDNKTKARSIKDHHTKGIITNENHNAEAIHSDTNKKFDNCITRSPQPKTRFSRTMSMSPLLRSPSQCASRLARSTSRINETAVPPTKSSLLSRRNNLDSSSANKQPMLSRKGSSTILFTNSSSLMKQPPTEMQLDCTLEELCFGCMKKVQITRDTVKDNGQIIEEEEEEEEVLAIKVKPGWNKGTKITFEGKGNEFPGAERADVIFVIAEKEHQFFKREGDDLELGMEIPLVEALTGSTIAVPLLGGTKMKLEIDDIIYPGYEKIIPGQGMPKQNEPGTRGDLKVTFLVEFPEELTQEQRLNVVNVLRDTIYS